LQEENQQLKDELQTNLDNVDAYFDDLNQIEENLQIIKEREEIISGETSGQLELATNQQDRINQDIILIGELMEKNRELITSLNNRIRNADQRIAGFEQMVARLNQSIEEKEIEIQMLRDQLSKMNLQVDFLMARVDTLEQESQMKSQLLQEQTLEMNAAWFAMGSRRELVEHDIISREGGFLGIGRSNRLKDDFNKDFFTRIDITRDFEITIIGDEPELITTHPADSYEIISDDQENKLVIINPDRFWSANRYLVIQIK
jgi:DNA repair exonuclease SbcCD ATPase subunit